MQEVDCKDWEEFEAQLKKLWTARDNFTSELKPKRELLYRGLPDSQFALTTTLERTIEENTSFHDYYDLISRVQPQIETFTSKTWVLPERDEFYSILDIEDFWTPLKAWGGSIYSYLIYLRHHGFPSPLLDWSKSPYVAAYFAFRSPIQPPEKKVSIHVYCEYWQGAKISSYGKASITTLGPYVVSHKRHFLQQAEYTICSKSLNKKYIFVPHSEVISLNKKEQDAIWKFTIPWSERTRVLRQLDTYNLNAFSLFDSEESLMETMTLREIDFRKKNI